MIESQVGQPLTVPVTVEKATVVTAPRKRVWTRSTVLVVARRLIALAVGVAQAVLFLKFALLGLAANPGNSVVDLIVRAGDAAEKPFLGMFSVDQVPVGSGAVVDVAALVALLAWTLVEGIVLGVLSLRPPRAD